MQVIRAQIGSMTWTAVAMLAFALTGCDSCQGETEVREREPLSLIPADSLLVASAEIRPIIATDAFKRIRRNYDPVEQYLGECDYDPMPHIDRVWVGAGEEYLKGRGVMVVMGPVNRDKVLKCYRDEIRRRGLAVEEEDVEGFNVYSAGPGRLHLAWLDEETVVVGDRAHTLKVLELERGKGKSVRTNQKLFKLWERLIDGNDTAIALLPDQDGLDRMGKVLHKNYQGLTTTRQAGVAFRLRKAKGMDLEVMLRLGEGDLTATLFQRFERDLANFRKNEYISIAGIDGHLKALNVERAGSEITASAHWTNKQVNSLSSLAVDSVDEIMRSSDPEKALRERFNPSKADAGPSKAGTPDGGAPDGGVEAAPDAAAASSETAAP